MAPRMAVPRALLKLASLPGVRAVPIWFWNRRYRRWKRRNPDGTFADFYAADAEAKIRKGKSHATLGVRSWASGRAGPVEWDRSTFPTRGRENWQQIVELGLEPEMRCVDYGCGSLRLGQHAIRYLDPGNYWGIDVSDAFYTEGLKLLPPELVAEKRPRFGVIGDPLLAEIRAWAPDFLFANAVLQHVPPDELGLFFRRLAAMMVPASRAYILFVADSGVKRIKGMSWAYPSQLLEREAGAQLPGFVVRLQEPGQAYQRIAGGNRKILCVEPDEGARDPRDVPTLTRMNFL
jgi:SAM-dependent methyltransferase